MRAFSVGLWCAGVLVPAALFWTTLAAAQDATLEEIVVTAQRKAQSVLSVPMSIQAITGEQLNDAGVKELSDLQFTVPGYFPSQGVGYTQLYIRGVGNNIFVGADPSVATYIDDVPRIYGSMVNQFLDVERVEVLKGAQGGLYGRNATGGVVNIITRQPSTEGLSGNALVDYGERETFRASGYANIPLTDKIAFSAAAERDSHDPYVRNIAASRTPYTAAMFPGGSLLGTARQTADFFNSGVDPAKGYGDQDFWAADAKLLVRPVEEVHVTIASDYSSKRDSEGSQYYQTIPANNQAVLTGYINAFTGANVQLPPGFIQGHDGNFTTSIGSPGISDLVDYGGSVTAVWNAPGADLTSISAFRRQRTTFFQDFGADTVPLVEGSITNRKWFAYQELRAVSSGEGPVRWLGGATYLTNHFQGDSQTFLVRPLFTTPSVHVNTTVHDWSVYVQAGYDITTRLNLTASGRYIHETNDTNFTTPVSSAASSLETRFLPSATLAYKLGDGNVYARWARGFKAGGVNPTASPSVFPRPDYGSVFGPETVDTYETGYRQGLMGGRIQLTGAVFYNDYKGLQVSAHVRPAFEAEVPVAIVNAGSARTWGVEETLQMRVAQPLTLGINASYLNAKYKSFTIVNNPILADLSLSGTQMVNAPKTQLSLTAALDQPLTDRLRLVGNAVEAYVSRVLFQQSGNPGILPDATGPQYWLTNLRLGIRTSDDTVGVSVFANNLFNRPYLTFGTSSAGIGNEVVWGNPRVVGGEITVRF